MTISEKRALLIAGPTASGKSALALTFARACGATIVNADSMQVYRDLRVLTARPPVDEERQAPHLMFGEIDGAVNFSVGRYEARVREILAATSGPWVFVGGTGLYFRALTQGLSDIPAVPDEVRARVRASAEGRETPELHVELAGADPETATRLQPSDRQRILRALEVFYATGRSLTAFQNARGAPVLAPGTWRGLFLAPERETLRRRIAVRFRTMLAGGALDEVAALASRQLDPALPIMRAHGAPALMAHLRGEMNLAEAAAQGVRDTQAYSKRQFTWARHQLPEFTGVAPERAAAFIADEFMS
jgi:tRNA dimethylallyltransferase